MSHRPGPRIAVVLAAALACAAVAGSLIAADSKPAAPAGPPPAKQSYRERYGVLADENIFLKERPRPASDVQRDRERENNSRNTYKPPPPEASFVLTGVVLEEGFYRAYVEDVPHGKVLRLNVGDPVARGQLTEIAIDAVTYESPDGQSWVEVGRDFRGQAFTSVMATLASTAPPTTGPTTGPATAASGAPDAAAAANIDPNNPNLSIEEKMRLRRLQGK